MNETVAASMDRIVTVFKSSGAKGIYIFGSTAKGTMRSDSDIDLAVSGLPPENFFSALSAASQLLDRPIHLIDLDEVTPFTEYLKEEGELQRVG